MGNTRKQADLPMHAPFRNIRVLELGRIFAAPWAGQMLGDLGAEVIKVEAVDGGDQTRVLGLGTIVDGDGKPTKDRSLFAAINRNKKSVAVDIAKPEGQDLVRRLAAECDVFIENFKVGDLKRRGLDYERIREINPKIIYMSLTGFGQTGPYRERPGMDNVVQGLSGFMDMTGVKDGPPVASPVSIMDFSAGMHAACGIMAALYERDVHGGPGQYIDISLLDSGMAMQGYKFIAFLLTGEQPERGARVRGFVPAGIFKASDGYFQMAIGPDADFVRFCKAVDHLEWLQDERFADRWARTTHQDHVQASVSAIFAAKTVKEWVAILNAADILASPVNSLAQALDDPQVKERGVVVNIKHYAGGDLPVLRNPIAMSQTEIAYRSPPLLGQHTDEVLGTLLKLPAEELDRLREAGVIA